MQKIDLKTDLKALYSSSAKNVQIVEVPRFQFIMIDGQIEAGQEPSSSADFQESIQALYGAAYTLKFMLKMRKIDPLDYPVMALEGLWWVYDGEFDLRKKDNWAFTLMILQPEAITPELFAEGLAQLRRKKGEQPAFARLRLEAFIEGLCIQSLHVGPYATEPATLERMEDFAAKNGYQFTGKHHEIYMGDPKKSSPEKLKTILRHPVMRA